jgi:hypothetical protein
MNTERNYREQLLEKCGYNVSLAKECYEFVVGKEVETKRIAGEILSGAHDYDEDEINLYYLYSTGDYATSFYEGMEVVGILLKKGKHKFAVSLHDATEEPVELCSEDTESNKYYEREVDAIFDYDGKSNTAALPLNEEIKLKDEEYIPSSGQLIIMCKVKDELNRMLTKCGGDTLKDDCYWSSTEYSGSNAWYVNLSNGNVNNWCAKATLQYRVRPVSAFGL